MKAIRNKGISVLFASSRETFIYVSFPLEQYLEIDLTISSQPLKSFKLNFIPSFSTMLAAFSLVRMVPSSSCPPSFVKSCAWDAILLRFSPKV